ncbi:MAG TPA: tyrosine-type recombinase/integrase [Chloroflexia bacterium]|nr:tyrosine-type recombinase/integrase [Chloroflexia bacterium]
MKTKTTDFNNSPSKRASAVKRFSSPEEVNSLNVRNVALAGNPATNVTDREESNPFRRLIYEWLDYSRQNQLSARTLADYREKLFKFWWWWDNYQAARLGDHPRSVTTREARQFAAYLWENSSTRWGEPVKPGKKQLSAASIAAYGRTVKVFFSWLELEGQIEKTPFNKSVKFTSKNRPDRVIKSVENEDLVRIFNYLMLPENLKSFTGRRNLAMLALLLDSGIRRGELLSLRVVEGEVDPGRKRCLVRGKTGQRYVMFSDGCAESLKAYLKLRQQISTECQALWLTEDGEPLSYYGFGTVIRRINKRTGVYFHAHRLRHTFASTLARQGIDPFTLKELLGHTTITTTQIYVRQNPERLAEAYGPRSPLKQLPAVQEPLKRRAGRPRKQG